MKKLQWISEIKEKDLAFEEKLINVKKKLSRTNLFDSLLAKIEPLSAIEMALKNKLITDMLS